MGLIGEVGEYAGGLLRLLLQDACLGHLPIDDLTEPLIPRQPEYVIHSVVFTPTHQRLTAKSGVGT